MRYSKRSNPFQTYRELRPGTINRARTYIAVPVDLDFPEFSIHR